MSQLAVNGVTLNYETTGDGPVVLLTHGFSFTGGMWDGQRDVLAPKYRLITWDARGHGKTESPDDPSQYSADLTVGDIKALLDHEGAGKAVVGGHSMGGYMSLAFYNAHPEAVRALVICNSGPGFRKVESREGWNKTAESQASRYDDAAKESPSGDAPYKVHRSAKCLAHAARGMLAHADGRVIEILPDIQVPTIIIIGDGDENFLGASNYMSTKIPNARLEVIKDAGHNANMDQPEVFNGILLDFLDSLG